MIKADKINDSLYPNGFYNRFESIDYEKKVPKRKIIFPKQRHGNKIIFLDHDADNMEPADGLLTQDEVEIGIKTADCIPMIISSEQSGLIGAVHVGWRGLYRGIIRNMADIIRNKNFDINESVFVIGPSIRQCCYKVASVFASKLFSKYEANKNIFKKSGKDYYFNLQGALFYELVACGAKRRNIEEIRICTSCDDSFFSFRRDNTILRNISFIGKKT